MTLELDLSADAPRPLEIPGFTPDAVRSKSLDEIRRHEIFIGRQPTPLGELVRVSGNPADAAWQLLGDWRNVHRLAAGMQAGQITVEGAIGRHCGSQMRGGTLQVAGDAGDWLGAEMRGGQIHVQGQAGDLVGAAYRGSRRGMTGGVILVEGDAGHEVGHTMRRGCIAVRGDLGQFAGFGMLAGTILTLGKCHARAGAGMRRGTIAVLGTQPVELLPTFRHASRGRSPILSVLLRSLAARGFSAAADLPAFEYDLYNGDFVALGRGELLVRAR